LHLLQVVIATGNAVADYGTYTPGCSVAQSLVPALTVDTPLRCYGLRLLRRSLFDAPRPARANRPARF
jgi:hypothetical protein